MKLYEEHVLVTGASGFVGQALLRKLKEDIRCQSVTVPPPKTDLCDPETALNLFRYGGPCPTVVFHLAAKVGGIGANRANPVAFFEDNMLMGINVLRAAQERCKGSLKKFVMMGTTCSYPVEPATCPFPEHTLWSGFPEPTNAPYGIAKKALGVLVNAYRDAHDFPGITVIPANMYGPGDHFNTTTSHVIPAIMCKVDAAIRANKDTVNLWGSGLPTRDMLYVDDCAEGLCLAAEEYNSPAPINLGTGIERSIASMALDIAEVAGWKGTFVWDASQLDGQPRRALDCTRAQTLLGWRPKTEWKIGLQRTWASLLAQRSR